MNSRPLVIQERTFARRLARLGDRWRRRPAARAEVPPDQRRGVALIGVGNVARWLYLPRLQAPHAPFRLAAVYDVDQAAAEAVAQQFGARACPSLDAVWHCPEIEAVLVCTPVRYHAEAVEAALRARKHVLCEKPLAYTLAEARTLCRQAQASGCVHMVNFSYRFRPDLMFAVRLIREGVLGRIYHALGTISQGLWFTESGLPSRERVDAAAWKFGPEGGVLLDLGPHLIDFARCCWGEIRQLQAWTRALRDGPAACEDVAGVSFCFEGGTTAQFLTSRWATGHRERTWLEVSGSQGALLLESGVVKLWTRREPRWRTLLIPPREEGDFLDCFARAIGGAPAGVPDFTDGLRNNEAIAAIFESARSRSAIDLPLVGDSSTESPSPTPASPPAAPPVSSPGNPSSS
jgi:predicted dehydrogenase